VLAKEGVSAAVGSASAKVVARATIAAIIIEPEVFLMTPLKSPYLVGVAP
jgi:hypothetical protein